MWGSLASPRSSAGGLAWDSTRSSASWLGTNKRLAKRLAGMGVDHDISGANF